MQRRTLEQITKIYTRNGGIPVEIEPDQLADLRRAHGFHLEDIGEENVYFQNTGGMRVFLKNELLAAAFLQSETKPNRIDNFPFIDVSDGADKP